ncbi:MAG: FlgD immunoglobulin-like domain containing protein [Candidatus Krumholzibacteriia bacterium]
MMTSVQSRGAQRFALLLIALSVVCFQVGTALAETKTFFFLHHSTGRNLMNEGDVRDIIEVVSSFEDVQLRVWDHDYNQIGLRDADAEYLGYSYEVPDDNTDPVGLHELWTTANAARDSILARYDVIAFKSCYHPACAITSDAQLQQYKDWYLDIRDELDRHQDKLFIIMSPPPLHRLVTELEWADRARDFATWLGSDEFLAGHPNLVYFNFFDRLAHPDDGSTDRNMLRYEYEITHDVPNGHPNTLANSVVGPEFAYFVVAAANRTQSVDVPAIDAALQLKAYPNPFNPRTAIRFSLTEAQPVRLDIYDLTGRHVRSLYSGALDAGPHEMSWQGRDDAGQSVPVGTFFCRLIAGPYVSTTPLTLLK